MAANRATPEGRAAQRAANKKWKAANPDKVKASAVAYRRRKGMKPAAPVAPKLTREEAAFDRKHMRALRIVARGGCDFSGWTAGEAFAWRYRNDPAFNMRQRMRASAQRMAKRFGWVPKRFGYEARRSTAGVLWETIGYTSNDLRAHIERQFTRGMTWRALLNGEIHIDHIRPVSSFDFDHLDQVRACYCLSNLRPVWAADNLRKSAKAEFLL